MRDTDAANQNDWDGRPNGVSNAFDQSKANAHDGHNYRQIKP